MAEGRTGRPSHRAAVLREIKARGEIELTALADALDISLKTVQRQCAALVAEGRAELRGEGAKQRVLDTSGAGANRTKPLYYCLLGVEPEGVYPDTVLGALIERVLPSLFIEGDDELFEAFYTLLWWQAEYDAEGHDGWIKRHERKDPTKGDDRKLRRLLSAACAAAEVIDTREGQDRRFSIARLLAEPLALLPGHIRVVDSDGIPDLDVWRAARTVLELDEFEGIRADSGRIEFAWRTVHAASCGKAVLGKAAKVSQRERDLWPDEAGAAPWWRVTIALDLWLGATDEQRERLVHHELMHLAVDSDGKPALRAHDVEEFVVTAKRYGASDHEQEQLVNALQQATDRSQNLLGVLSGQKGGA